MSLPLKLNRDEDEWQLPDVPRRKLVESAKVGLRNRSLLNNGTAEVAKFSRLSAQMVELSLQQAQRDPTLHDTPPAKLTEVSSVLHDTLPVEPKAVSQPLPWPSTSAAPPRPPQPQGTPRESKIPNYRPNHWKDVRRNLDNWLAGARVSGFAAVGILREHAKSAQKKFAGLNFGSNSIKSPDGIASRLWTPTGLAALSAVLVVGVIAGVRHYAHSPSTPQDRSRNTSPAIPAMQDKSQPRPSSTVKSSTVNGSIVNTNGTAAVQHPTTSSAAKHAPAGHAPAEARIRKVRRKHADDDYVAKDTFVSYDAKGKPVQGKPAR